MENNELTVKPVIKNIYEDVFSTRFIVHRDSLKHNSKSPVWAALNIPADLIIKNVNSVNSRYPRAGKLTLHITVTAILEVKEEQDD